jgi:hypothetical protein
MTIDFSRYNAIGSSNLWSLRQLNFQTITPIRGGTIATLWNPILKQILHKVTTEPNLLIFVGK